MAHERPVLFAAFSFVIAAAALNAQSVPEKVADVNGTTILAADVDAKLGQNLAKLQEQIYSLRQKQLDSMIDQKLLEEEAARRGVTIATLVQTEITSHVTPVTAADVTAFYEENKAKLQGDVKALESQIRNFLAAQRAQVRQQAYMKSLRAAAKIAVFLTPPAVHRSEVKTAGAPVRGAANAPVTIVEFSDFHCPYCRRAQPTLDQLRVKYGDKIKIVYRDFPIDSLHPQARLVSEAARCANEQGRFWEFHDRVYVGPTEGSPATLKKLAEEAGLDSAAFEACTASRKYQAAVQTDVQEGASLGITGTPAFFINGRFLSGAQPLEAFARIIDDELAARPTQR